MGPQGRTKAQGSKMGDYEIALTDCLTEAGFDTGTINEAVRLYKTGRKDDHDGNRKTYTHKRMGQDVPEK